MRVTASDKPCNVGYHSRYSFDEVPDIITIDKESELVLAARGGDHNAFAQLLEAHLSHVRTFLALKAPVPQLVDELAHETFVFAFRHLDEFQAGTSFRAWVRAIAWNLLRAEVQRYAREQTNKAKFIAWQLAEWDPSAGVATPAPEVDLLHDCLDQLDSPLRELITLKYRDDESAETIATRFKRSLVWVRVSLFRVREQLRQCIEAKLRGRQPC